MLFKGILYRDALINIHFDLVIRFRELGHQVKHLIQLILWDGDNALDWVTQDDITLSYMLILVFMIPCVGGKRVAYRVNDYALDCDWHIESPRFCLCSCADCRCILCPYL